MTPFTPRFILYVPPTNAPRYHYILPLPFIYVPSTNAPSYCLLASPILLSLNMYPLSMAPNNMYPVNDPPFAHHQYVPFQNPTHFVLSPNHIRPCGDRCRKISMVSMAKDRVIGTRMRWRENEELIKDVMGVTCGTASRQFPAEMTSSKCDLLLFVYDLIVYCHDIDWDV